MTGSMDSCPLLGSTANRAPGAGTRPFIPPMFPTLACQLCVPNALGNGGAERIILKWGGVTNFTHSTGAAGPAVWFCACWKHYHGTEAAFLQHLHQTGSAAMIVDLAGQNGLDRDTQVQCKRMLVIDAKEDNDQDAAVDAPVAAIELQPVVQHGFNVCVHFSVPYVRESVLVFLAVLTVAAFTGVIACACADMTGAGDIADWAERFRKDVAVRIALCGGAAGRRELQSDADLMLDFEMNKAIAAFVGDRTEHGGVSTRG